MIKNIIYDLGGVLIDWDPRYMYRTIFESEEAMEYFLANICTSDWNEQQDGGRLISEANACLIATYPQYKAEIEAFYNRWTEMLGGPVAQMVAGLQTIAMHKKQRLVALTNWSAETWPEATSRYDFLNIFEGILVSGHEQLKKPDPAIYQLLCDRYDLVAEESLFIDDNHRNIVAAQQLGIQTIHHISSDSTLEQLQALGLLG